MHIIHSQFLYRRTLTRDEVSPSLGRDELQGYPETYINNVVNSVTK